MQAFKADLQQLIKESDQEPESEKKTGRESDTGY